MELFQEGLTICGQKYEWFFCGDVTLYHDASGDRRRLVTHINAGLDTGSGTISEPEYADDTPAALSLTERKGWDEICCEFLVKETDILNRILNELRWYVGEQAKNMKKETPGKRVISSDEYDLLYHGAQNAIASALSVSNKDIDILNYKGGANIINAWFGDLLETEGYILEG